MYVVVKDVLVHVVFKVIGWVCFGVWRFEMAGFLGVVNDRNFGLGDCGCGDWSWFGVVLLKIVGV